MCQRLFHSLCAILVLTGCLLLPPDGTVAETLVRQPQGFIPQLTVSKETTYFTKPVAPDSSIDYEAALNQFLSWGVTPQNNAVVLLWQIHGPLPTGFRGSARAKYFRLLGIAPPPVRGDYLVDLPSYVRQVDPTGRLGEKLIDNFLSATTRPWSAQRFPHIAKWLAKNKKPLDRLSEATKRSHYYSPLVSPNRQRGTSHIGKVPLHELPTMRELAFALAARAMHHVSHKRYSEAWQDLQTNHKLARLVAQGGTSFHHLVGVIIDLKACDAELAFLQDASLTKPQLKQYREDLRKQPAMPTIIDKLDVTERVMFLDQVMHVAYHGLPALERLAGKRPRSFRHGLKKVDWDVPLKAANRWFDRIVKTLRVKDRSQREQQIRKIRQELRVLKSAFANKTKMLRHGFVSDQQKSRLVGDVLMSLKLPAFDQLYHADERRQQTQRNVLVAFVLEAYRLEHGNYPQKLPALTPQYLAEVPQDLFSGQSLIYRPDATGYLLYSVGNNGKDEAGRTKKHQPRGDDLSVRMRLPAN